MKKGKKNKKRDVDKKTFYYKSKHLELKGSSDDKEIKKIASVDQRHSIILRYLLPVSSLIMIGVLVTLELYPFTPLGAMPYALKLLNSKIW